MVVIFYDVIIHLTNGLLVFFFPLIKLLTLDLRNTTLFCFGFITPVTEVKIHFPEKSHCMIVKSFAIKNCAGGPVRSQNYIPHCVYSSFT